MKAAPLLLLILPALTAKATEFVSLHEHPELRPLYSAANRLYEAASGCRPEEDCVCLHQEKVSPALEKLLKIHVSFPQATDTFILDERGALKSERGRGVLVRRSELVAIEQHLLQCGKLPLREAADNEAQVTLKAIYAAESAHYLRTDHYVPMKAAGYNAGCAVPRELGFKLAGCTDARQRYSYMVRVAGNGQTFVAEARSATGGDHPIVPGCTVADVWTIDQDQHLKNVTSAQAKCPVKKKP
jgi:hypothetical protein